VVAHAFVEGAGSEPEGEDAIVVGGAGTVRAETFAGLDYVALGHLHGAREVGGEGRARYSGSIYPYSFAEAGHEKTVEVVDLDASGVQARRLPIAVQRGVRVIEGRSFEQVMDEAPSVSAAERDDYVLVRVTDTGPIDHALPRLREHYPNALLQQPAIQVDAPAVHFDGDVRTIGVEEAFRSFYRHVYRDDMSEMEEAILVEVLSQDDDADAEDAAQEASA
jgi:DNA repair protein SbcD/Mre11